jgi:hypothetical protein
MVRGLIKPGEERDSIGDINTVHHIDIDQSTEELSIAETSTELQFLVSGVCSAGPTRADKGKARSGLRGTESW